MTKKSNRELAEFRKIGSLDFLYEINEDGTILRNVKSKKRIKIKMDYHHSKAGCYMAWVSIKGKVRRVIIHKVVAECWLGKKPNGYEIDHIDRNSLNNHYTNLRYVTHSKQMKNRVLSDRTIEQAKRNCLNYCLKYVAKKVSIKKDGQTQEFRSMTKASEFIAKEYGAKTEHIRSKFKQRRKKIYDYEISYNAEA